MKWLPYTVLCLPLFFSQCQNNQSETPQSEVQLSMNESDQELSGKNALYHAKQLTDMGDRSPQSAGFAKQCAYIKKYLSQYGWQVKDQSFKESTPQGELQFTNLRARFGTEASWNKAPKLLITCHADTKPHIPDFVGANDGASGVALIIELARYLQKYPQLAHQIELVFFDGEESIEPHMSENDGLYGSKYYTKNQINQLPEYMINLDMVGRQGMKIRIPSNTSQFMYTLYKNGIKELQLNTNKWGVAGMAILDDHVPFQEQGVEVIDIIDDFTDGSWWHTKKDNFSILSADSMKQCGQMTIYMIKQLLK